MQVKFISEDNFEFSSEKLCKYYETEKERFTQIEKIESEKLLQYDAYKVSSLSELVWVFSKVVQVESDANTLFYEIFKLINFDTSKFPFYFIPEIKKTHLKLIELLSNDMENIKNEIKEKQDRLNEIKQQIKELKNK